MSKVILFSSMNVLLTFFLVVLLTAMASAEKDVLCVKTHNHPTFSAACYTFVDYLRGYQHLFISNTTVHFIEGEHIINGSGNISEVLSLANLEDFTLEGPAVPHGELPAATVRCTRPFHFLFTNMTRLVIRNINIIKCTPIYSTFSFSYYNYHTSEIREKKSLTVTASLMTITTYYMELYNVHITESSGHGLFSYDPVGTANISYCCFHDNSGNVQNNRPGGNMFIAFKDTTLIAQGFRNHRVEISWSNFHHGYNPMGSGGLYFITHTSYEERGHMDNTGSGSPSGDLETTSDSDDVECLVIIQITNSQFYTNTGKYGGNVHISNEGTVIAHRIEVDNCMFNNATGGSFGSRNMNARAMVIKISNSTFAWNLAEFSGGAIRTSSSSYHRVDSKVSIINCTFSDNRALKAGGAISIKQVYLCASICKFQNNTASKTGGHINAEDSTLSIINSWFKDGNSLIGNGGGIYLSSNDALMLISVYHSIFTNNLAGSSGGALYIYGSDFHPEENLITITNCTFSDNTASNGGAISTEHASVSVTSCTLQNNVALEDGGAITITHTLLFVTQCSFENNTAQMNGGHINFDSSVILSLENCLLEKGNSLRGDGGGVYVSNIDYLTLKVLNCTFLCNTARSGGGLGVVLMAVKWDTLLVKITDCHFVDNNATHGGGMYMSITEFLKSTFSGEIYIQQSWFIGNTADSGGGLEAHFIPHVEQRGTMKTTVNTTQFIGNVAREEGSAINLLGCGLCLDGGSLVCKPQLSLTMILTYLLFTKNRVRQLTNRASTINGNMISIRLESTDFILNIGSGILASNTKITTNGENIFKDNIAIVGGALHLDCYPTSLVLPNNLLPGYSWEEHEYIKCTEKNFQSLTLSEDSLTIIRNNTVIHLGGAIAANEQCAVQPSESDIPSCFFRAQTLNNSHGGKVLLDSNKALIAGNEVYGGPMQECIYDSDPSIDPTKKFTSIFITENQTLTSVDVMADPIRLCFCLANGIIEGSYCPNTTNVTVFQGQQFTITAIPVTSLTDDSSTKYVKANLHPEQSTGELGMLQRAQEVNRTCDNLTYSVRTAEYYEELRLTLIEEPTSQISIIHVHFLPCPFGFEPSGEPPQCDCAKHLTATVTQLTCDINSITVLLPSRAWIGNFSQGLVAHLNCPYDYCNDSSREVKLEEQDAQCSHSRSGVLCGSCRPGLSLALGSSTCLYCSNVYLLLLLPFTAAGVALVAVLQKGDLTVSKGYLNGFIFYANIIQANKAIFFPPTPQTILTKIIAALIAWINLDFGIETCFANGLNAMAKAWLQFVFPVYVWIMVLVMIYGSRYSVTISKLTGSNTVPVLATLFLLSYTKLLRTLIVAISPIAITDESGTSHLRWIADANIAFLRGAHIPLFLMAFLMMVTYIVPLTAVVTLAPCLQARTRHPLLRWVVRIKPLLDAYTGPYRDKHRYWTGFMLLTRITLFIIFAANSTGDPKLNLLAIIVVTAGVSVLQKYGQLYRRTANGTLEVLHLLNLLIISAITLFLQGRHFFPMAQEIVACVTVSFSLLIFAVTAAWQVWKKIAVRTSAQQKLAGILKRLSLRKPQEPPKETKEADNVPQLVIHAPPTVSVIDMNELREPVMDTK